MLKNFLNMGLFLDHSFKLKKSLGVSHPIGTIYIFLFWSIQGKLYHVHIISFCIIQHYVFTYGDKCCLLLIYHLRDKAPILSIIYLSDFLRTANPSGTIQQNMPSAQDIFSHKVIFP